MKNFKTLNNVTGWFVFLIAAVVYLITMEPTASFWDCGEFISTAFKQQVGHPPGAPFFMIMGRFFTLFAGNNLEMIAWWMNSMSALMSAFTILFLFWTITHLARKLLQDETGNLDNGGILTVLGAGIVGAMAYTFSDTFWFSAVEAEVYASSSFVTAFVFWAILKWENVADQPHSSRWLILIAYLMGLSIGIHLLNLLAIPALVFVYYFKKYTVTRSGIIWAFMASVALLGGIMYVIIPGVPALAALFERMFVNGFGLPFNSGLIFYILLLAFVFVWAIRYTHRNQKVLINTILVGVAMILIGYSSYGMIIIRSLANPTLDENNPETIFNLQSYLNREQYGDRPLFKGQFYNAPLVDIKKGKKVYTRIGDKYVVTMERPEYVFDPSFTTLFPRMYSEDPRHVEAYKRWGKVKGTPVRLTDRSGKAVTEYVPTFGENLRFFFQYQIRWMYVRYFMWNFAGRQNDIQGHGEKLYGNWISGIPFIDEARLGPQDNLPSLLENNPGRNQYYFLPLILGLAGLFFHLYRNKKDFTVVLWLFFMTGLAIVLYLNQKPFEPRERDYAYAGSFYAFAIWIGLGVLAVADLLKKGLPKIPAAVISTVLCLVLVPGIMASENWDDHDRSGRYTARDFAWNYLQSCEPNGIIFTNGDNDTFPLWYIQEVENVRTDVRVVNLSYLGADWYIAQMKHKAYLSDPLPISFDESQFIQGKRDAVYMSNRLTEAYPLKDLINFVRSDDPRHKMMPNYMMQADNFPTRSFFIDIDTADIMKKKVVRDRFKDKLVTRMDVTLENKTLTKSDLMVLDMLATNDWKRPIYFAITVSRENWLKLDPWFQLHGLSYKIVPVQSQPGNMAEPGGIDPEIMYDNLMNKFRWGGIDKPGVYIDENNQRMLVNFRNGFARLSDALLAEGKTDSARKVLDRVMEVIPSKVAPHNYFSLPIIEGFYRLNQPELANSIVREMKENYKKELLYYNRLNQVFPREADQETRVAFYILQDLARQTQQYDQQDLFKEVDNDLKEVAALYGISGLN